MYIVQLSLPSRVLHNFMQCSWCYKYMSYAFMSFVAVLFHLINPEIHIMLPLHRHFRKCSDVFCSFRISTSLETFHNSPSHDNHNMFHLCSSRLTPIAHHIYLVVVSISSLQKLAVFLSRKARLVEPLIGIT